MTLELSETPSEPGPDTAVILSGMALTLTIILGIPAVTSQLRPFAFSAVMMVCAGAFILLNSRRPLSKTVTNGCIVVVVFLSLLYVVYDVAENHGTGSRSSADNPPRSGTGPTQSYVQVRTMFDSDGDNRADIHGRKVEGVPIEVILSGGGRQFQENPTGTTNSFPVPANSRIRIIACEEFLDLHVGPEFDSPGNPALAEFALTQDELSRCGISDQKWRS
jgi:hypothetical protein